MARGWGVASPHPRGAGRGDVGRPDPDDNPAPRSRIRSIRALDLGLAPMSGVCRALVGALDWLAERGAARLWGRTASAV